MILCGSQTLTKKANHGIILFIIACAGQYWGEGMGFFRIEAGQNMLGIESHVSWATPGHYTIANYPCAEDGKNCGPTARVYRDPSTNVQAVKHRLLQHKALS